MSDQFSTLAYIVPVFLGLWLILFVVRAVARAIWPSRTPAYEGDNAASADALSAALLGAAALAVVVDDENHVREQVIIYRNQPAWIAFLGNLFWFAAGVVASAYGPEIRTFLDGIVYRVGAA
jgi:hypothetical protein